MKKLIALLMALILTLSLCPVLAEGEMTVEEVIAQAQTIELHVVTPQRESEPTVWDDMIWFLSGLFA